MPKGVYERNPAKETIIIRIELEDANKIKEEIPQDGLHMSWSEIMKKYVQKHKNKQIQN